MRTLHSNPDSFTTSGHDKPALARSVRAGAFTVISGFIIYFISLKPPLLALPNKYVTYVEVAFDTIMKNRNMRVSFVARPPRYEKVSRDFHAPKYADTLSLLLIFRV